jgi:uncharacterized protein YbjQ (UPF0145 family)
MVNPKDILVITTSAIEGFNVLKHLNPVSAHIVSGTNLLDNLSKNLLNTRTIDSDSCQKKIGLLYNEAIEKIKYNTHEIGGNCVIGLSFNMNEISEKGKPILLMSVTGTAVIIEKKETKRNISALYNEETKAISYDEIKNSQYKNKLIKKANDGSLSMDDESWQFLIYNQVDEVFDYVKSKLEDLFGTEKYEEYVENFICYTKSLKRNKKIEVLYKTIKTEENEQTLQIIINIIDGLHLYEFQKIMKLLNSEGINGDEIGIKNTSYAKSIFNENGFNEC